MAASLRPTTQAAEKADPSKYKLLGRFLTLATYSQSTDHSHEIKEVIKYKKGMPKSIWILKTLSNKEFALHASIEVCVQEIMRFIQPMHPKTRLVKDEKNQLYIASKKVEQETKRSASKAGLGEILVLALWLNEIDLKDHNILIDKQDHTIKIDGGGGCLAKLLPYNFAGDYTITEPDLAALPFLYQYHPYNWLDLYLNGTKKSDSPACTALAHSPGFRYEVNEALLKIILLPYFVLQKLVGAYCENSRVANVILQEVTARREQLFAAAITNISFRQYLANPAARVTLDRHLAHISFFKTMRKEYLLEKIGLTRDQMNFRFNDLVHRYAPRPIAPMFIAQPRPLQPAADKKEEKKEQPAVIIQASRINEKFKLVR